jgi:serine/threonine protein kinase
MTAPRMACSHEKLERFLDASSTPEEELQLTVHLDECSSCREALSRSAAGDLEWDEVKVWLTDDDLDHAADLSRPGGSLDTFERRHPDETALVLSSLAPTDDPHSLGRLGTYEIVGVVGRGGFGVVLKAQDRALNRFVAIKVLAPHLAASASARRRFARVAQAAAAVVHENVVAIHAVSEREGLPYLVMEYVRGESLQRRIDRVGPFGTAEILRVGHQVAAGLAAAHAQGLVHRDVKPANILLEEGVERLKLTDFGLARAADDASLTRTGAVSGTPQYMSPEQARGESIDSRSDLFSLGSTLYAMAAGRPPFRAETSLAVLRRITDEPARSLHEIVPEIPTWLAALIGKLHAKEAGSRFDSAADAARTFGECLAHLQDPAKTPLPDEVSRLVAKPKRRLLDGRQRLALVGGTTLLLVSGAIALATAAALGRPDLNESSASDSPSIGLVGPESPGNAATESLSHQDAVDWGDADAETLNSIRNDVDRLEAESVRLFEAP